MCRLLIYIVKFVLSQTDDEFVVSFRIARIYSKAHSRIFLSLTQYLVSVSQPFSIISIYSFTADLFIILAFFVISFCYFLLVFLLPH